MVMGAAESFVDAEPKQQVALLLVARKLMDCLQANIVMPDLRQAKTTRAKPADAVYQFKITLLESHPPDLAAHPGQGLHPGQVARTHSDGDGLD